MTRLYINTGNKNGVSPRHILSAILQESDINKKYVGDIDIYDKFTFVEVQKEYANLVVDRVNNKKIKGNKVLVEVANPKK